MNKKDTIGFIKRRIRTLAEQARRKPETAQAAYGYMEQARRWAVRHGLADLVTATREAKDFIITISGKANGQAPDGVLYPRISMELHPFKNYRDIPKEWKEPLVSKEVAEEAERHE